MLKIPELTINWHILEACNYRCYYCYAKYGIKTKFSNYFSAVLKDLSTFKGKRIDLLSGSVLPNSVRINFAGGEPFLAKDFESAISLSFDLGLRPSFISNGSLITDRSIEEYGPMISVAGFSIDSFGSKTNEKIGRKNNKGLQLSLERLSDIFSLFREVSKDCIKGKHSHM